MQSLGRVCAREIALYERKVCSVKQANVKQAVSRATRKPTVCFTIK